MEGLGSFLPTFRLSRPTESSHCESLPKLNHTHSAYFFYLFGVGGMRRQPLNPPAPACRARACKTQSLNPAVLCSYLQLTKHPGTPPLPPTPPKVARTFAFSRQLPHLFAILCNFLPIKKPSKICLLQKPQKITKIRPSGAEGLNLRRFSMPFRLHFASIFHHFREQREP